MSDVYLRPAAAAPGDILLRPDGADAGATTYLDKSGGVSAVLSAGCVATLIAPALAVHVPARPMTPLALVPVFVPDDEDVLVAFCLCLAA